MSETASDPSPAVADFPAVAMIGLGNIGLPAARRLLEAGHAVHGYRRSPCPELVEAGGTFHGSAAEATTASDLVFQCLPGEPALRASGLGENGVVSAAREGQIVVELGTYTADVKREYRDALAARGAILVEAEVSGTPDLLAAGKAALFVGTDPDTFARVAPLLKTLSPATIPVGDFGAALSMKLVANLLVATHTAVAAEAIALGEALGLDGRRIVDVIGKSPAASDMFRIRAPRMIARDYLPAPGPIATLAKYLDLIGDAGDAHGLSIPAFRAAKRAYEEAAEAGLAEHDIAVLREWVGAHRGMPDG